MGPAVRFSNVSKSFDGVRAVSDLSLAVREGALFGLLGPNGAGKTTAIRMMMSIFLPDSGSVEVFGMPAGGPANRFIGYLPEERGLYRKMKVGETLLFLAELKQMDRSAARREGARWLERLDLATWEKRRVEDLSKGMQQKLQFIAAIQHDPQLLILDEPFAGLDPLNANLLKEIVLERQRAGRTVLLSTHRMEQVEQMCDSIALINRSRLVLEGDPRRIRREAGRNRVRVDFDKEVPVDAGQWPGVAQFETSGAAADVRLEPGADSHEYLQYLVDRGRVRRFECVEPPLEEIFIATVKETDGAALGDHAA